MTRIRPITDEDVDALAVLHVRTWQAAYAGIVPAEVLDALDPAEFARARRARVVPPGAATVVAETDDGGLAGFANYGPCPLPGGGYDETIGQLYAIYVAPERWGTGAGHALMAVAREALSDLSEIRLWVLTENHRARRFYEREGFTPDGASDLWTPSGSTVELPEIRYSTRR